MAASLGVSMAGAGKAVALKYEALNGRFAAIAIGGAAWPAGRAFCERAERKLAIAHVLLLSAMQAWPSHCQPPSALRGSKTRGEKLMMRRRTALRQKSISP